MSQTDTVTLYVNEVSSGGPADNLEQNLGNVPGVHSVEVGKTPQHGHGPSPSLVKQVTITFDPNVTTAQGLRASLEDLGYAVTVMGDPAR